jgi:tetratricopeptide (TPR) repeat protein
VAHRRAVAAEPEARAALAWAQGTGAPVADPLAVALATRIADLGRTADALEIVAPLTAAPIADPDLDAMAALAEAYVLLIRGDGRAALERIDRAAEPREPGYRSTILSMRSFMLTSLGETGPGVEAAERGVALARESDELPLAGSLLLCAQAHLYHDDFDRARERFAEAEREDARVPVQLLRQADTFRGDLAMKLGRPADALAPYARSLASAEAQGNQLQVLFDLLGIANALAELARDAESLEAAGLAEAQGVEVSSVSDFADSSFTHLLGDTAVMTAAERMGAAGDEHVARGRAVPAARRVARALELARTPVPA